MMTPLHLLGTTARRAIARCGLSAALVLLLASCGHAPTSVRLQVQYDDSWALTAFDVAARSQSSHPDAAHELVLEVPDGWAGAPLSIQVTGLQGDERWAHGEVQVTPAVGSEVTATVVLARLPCGAWCTPGATRCEGDGVVACEQRDSDMCMEWSTAVPCGPDAPSCSLGVCRSECVDECAQGETRCAGPSGMQQCGNVDSDSCLEWKDVVTCADGQTCSNGQCADTCTDECAEGDVSCRDSGVVHCGDLNADGCLEWGPVMPCDSGQSCQAGACQAVDSCTDECTAAMCNGMTLTQCGNYDLDPCLEPSPGTSCVPSDPCMEGRCTVDGCQSAPKVCNDPPSPTCVDANTLRTFMSSGTCSAGTCTYPHSDTTCPSGCDAGSCVDGCAGVTCDSPPSVCYQSTGTCGGGGTCSYDPHDGVSCDDGDPCTSGDTCASGACSGTAVSCDSPPSPTCTDASTLRTYMSSGTCGSDGTCSYPHTDTTCPSGCSGGACSASCTPGPWTTDVVDSAASFMSITVDSSSLPHISYVGGPALDRLHYARRNPDGSWSVGTVDDTTNAGEGTSIAVGPSGGVHIAYYDQTNGDLRYAHEDAGGSWVLGTVDSAGDVGFSSSIAVDDAGGLHISYGDYTTGSVKYAYRPTGGSWSFSTVDSSDLPNSTSLAVDTSGQVHIGYVSSHNSVRYATGDSSGWTTADVDSTATAFTISLALDRTGGVHASYESTTSAGTDLRHAYSSSGGSWTTHVVDSAHDISHSSIGVDSGGGVHIGYHFNTATGAQSLHYAHRSPGGAWALATVDSSGGGFTSLSVDGADGVHVSYNGYGQLKWAYLGCP